jgi:hypothetical protein
MTPAEYTSLSLDEVAVGLDATARDSEAWFGLLDATQLNWRPDATRWSVAQCLAHLIVSNERTQRNAERALDASQPRTIWQRLPVVPGLIGPALVKSQAPGATRKFKTSPWAQPAVGKLAGDTISRFARQQRELAAWIRDLDAEHAGRAIMESPFGRAMAYSVLNACRLVLAHDHRHLAQARCVMDAPGFPNERAEDRTQLGSPYP